MQDLLDRCRVDIGRAKRGDLARLRSLAFPPPGSTLPLTTRLRAAVSLLPFARLRPETDRAAPSPPHPSSSSVVPQLPSSRPRRCRLPRPHPPRRSCHRATPIAAAAASLVLLCRDGVAIALPPSPPPPAAFVLLHGVAIAPRQPFNLACIQLYIVGASHKQLAAMEADE